MSLIDFYRIFYILPALTVDRNTTPLQPPTESADRTPRRRRATAFALASPTASAVAAFVLLAVFTRPAAHAAEAVDPFRWDAPGPASEGVRARARPELDPLGIPVGAYRFYPSFKVAARYDDNVFRTETDPTGDLAIVAGPRFRLTSAYANHKLEVRADADIYKYFRQTTENRENVGVEADGRIDIDRDAALFASAGFRRRHENRASPDTNATQRPVRIDTLAAGFAGEKRFGRLSLRAEAEAEVLDFGDALDVGLSRYTNNDDRDRAIWQGAIGASYAAFEGAAPFVRIAGNISDYQDAADDGGFDRDSVGLDARTGVRIATGVAAAELYIGYLGQYYGDDGPSRLNRDAVEAFNFGATATANITALTTLNARAERSLFETTLAGSPGGVLTLLEAGADHELLRNLLLSASAGARFLAYEGIDRDDFGLLFRLGAVYMMNRHLRLEAGFEHETYRSNGGRAGIDRTANRIVLSLTSQP